MFLEYRALKKSRLWILQRDVGGDRAKRRVLPDVLQHPSVPGIRVDGVTFVRLQTSPSLVSGVIRPCKTCSLLFCASTPILLILHLGNIIHEKFKTSARGGVEWLSSALQSLVRLVAGKHRLQCTTQSTCQETTTYAKVSRM